MAVRVFQLMEAEWERRCGSPNKLFFKLKQGDDLSSQTFSIFFDFLHWKIRSGVP
jgi:hypothetical protein